MKVHKYDLNSDLFTTENDLSFYILGAFMTDGCVSKHSPNKSSYKCSIVSKDKEWIEDIRNIISPKKPISNDSSYWKFSITDMQFAKWLMSYGCLPNKSKTLEIMKDIPEKYHRDFIRGAIDGDGSISQGIYATHKKKTGKTYFYKRTSCYICGVSLEFIKQLRSIIPSYINGCIVNTGIRETHLIRGKEIKSTCNLYRVSFNGKGAEELIKWSYYEGNNISLERKQKYLYNLSGAGKGT